MKKHTLLKLALTMLAAAVLAPHPMSAQNSAPAINFESANPLTLPDDIQADATARHARCTAADGRSMPSNSARPAALRRRAGARNAEEETSKDKR